MIGKQPEQSTKKKRKKEREREREQNERVDYIYIIYRYRMDGFSRHYDPNNPNNHPADENDPHVTLIPGISCPVSSHA